MSICENEYKNIYIARNNDYDDRTLSPNKLDLASPLLLTFQSPSTAKQVGQFQHTQSVHQESSSTSIKANVESTE